MNSIHAHSIELIVILLNYLFKTYKDYTYEFQSQPFDCAYFNFFSNNHPRKRKLHTKGSYLHLFDRVYCSKSKKNLSFAQTISAQTTSEEKRRTIKSSFCSASILGNIFAVIC